MKRRNVKENKRILEDTTIFRYSNHAGINSHVSDVNIYNTTSLITKMSESLEDKLKEVKEIRKKLKEEGHHQPLSWEQVKKAITYNWQEQEKYE